MNELHDTRAGEELTDEALVEQVVSRLSAAHGDVGVEELTRRVAEVLASFVGAPIRHFLPVLVERRVGAQLS